MTLWVVTSKLKQQISQKIEIIKMTTQKIAVVTGGNKGIGYAIVKGLCEKFNGTVYLTARDVGRGQAAVNKLKALGFNPLFHQLDLTDQSSVDKFKDYIKIKHGGIDVLINNAAILIKSNAAEPLGVQAEKTLKTNYFGTLRVCEALFPLLRNNAKVVNVSSSAGHLSKIPSADVREKLGNPSITIPELNKLMEKYMKDAKENKAQEEGWGTSTYFVSKVGLSALSFVQQRLFDKEQPNRNIAVNAVHPGFVDTDLVDHKGPLTIEEGAKAPLYLALEANLKGKYVWYDSQIVDWYAATTPTH